MSFNKSRSGKIHPEGGSPGAPAGIAAAASASPSLSGATSLRAQRSLRRGASGREQRDEEAERKGLGLSEEEHRELLQRRVRLEGRQSLWDLLRFYCRMLVPVAIVCVWMFAMFAAISYSIPNLLCNRIAKENSVS